jgi:pimeloyl-ACP methyl ester carboxylesterase
MTGDVPPRTLCVSVYGGSADTAVDDGAFPAGERIVICPPLAEEHGHARGALHRLAMRLAEQGQETLVYDPSGHGDSEGDLCDLAPDDLVADLARAAGHPAMHGAPTVVIGLRFGAAIAARAVARGLISPARLVLVEPVLRGAPYAQELVRKNVAAQIASLGAARADVRQLLATLASGGAIEVEGHALTSRFHGGLLRCDAVADLASGHARSVVVDVILARARSARPSSDVLELARLRPVSLHRIEVLPPWKEDRHHLVSDVPAIASCVLALLARRSPALAAGGGDG